MPQVAVGEQHLRQAVHAPRVQERFDHKLRGRFAAAIDQQIVRPPRRVHKNRIAAAQREDRDARVRTVILPVDQRADRQRANADAGPQPPRRREEPPGHRPEQERVISDEFNPRRGRNINESGGKSGEPVAEFDHGFHPEPAAVIEQFIQPGPPRRQQAAEVARQREAAQRNDDEVRQQTDRSEQMKIAGDERQRTEPRGQ